MEYAQEEYTKHYIVTALFKLMHAYEYEKIKVTDIAQKAGVGRATFYRYFKNKEDVITYYFEHHVLGVFKANKEPFRLLKRAHLSDLYLNFLNKNFSEMFAEEHPDKNPYLPYLYAGMLYNVSMRWLENDCAEDIPALAALIVDAIYTK